MPELKKRRACLALLGAFAMVASVLAVGASSVSAEAGRPEAAADYSACVGPATADAGFTDVAAGSTHDAAINCIAYYGITRGTTATTFSPGQTISRWQLAVMLQRAAAPAGVELPTAASQGFTDISGLGSSFQAAVNQMAELGIMAGTTATTFDPDGIVSRAVIVEALAGFLTNAQVGPGGKALSRGVDRSLTVKDGTTRSAVTIPIDETFRDLGAVTYSAFQSIQALAEMGVVQGRSDGTFGPAASVTRGQAAAFITRALAHTNARPAGLTMQAKDSAVSAAQDVELSVSMRDNDFAPVESAAVDFFTYSASNAARAFKTDGTCNTVQAGGGGGSDVCVIEIDDAVTEPDGNLLLEPSNISADTVYWAWSGATGDRLDWDTSNLSMDNSDVSSAASVTVGTVASPAKAKVTLSVSSDAANGNTVPYGTTVTVTIQLQDSADKDIGVAGRTYSWFASGEHTQGSTLQIAGIGTRTVTTDSDGRAAFTLTQPDPVPGNTDTATENRNNATTWTYRITAVPIAGGAAGAAPAANTDIGFTVAAGGTGTGTVVFDDDDPKAQKVSIELRRDWGLRPTAAGTVASVGVTGKVTDQYGSPLRGQNIFFDLDGNDEFGCADMTGCGDSSDTASTAIANHDDGNLANDEIAGANRRVTRANGTNTVKATLSSSVTDRDAHYMYKVAADLNNDGDVGGTGEIATRQFVWAYYPTGWNSETGMIAADGGTPANDNFVWRRIYGFDPASNTLLKVSRYPDNTWTPTKAHAITYRDGDTFQWYVAENTSDLTQGPDSNGTRWLTVAEFEARLAKFLEAGESVIRSSTRQVLLQMRVRQFNANGTSFFEVALDAGSDIGDPPATP